MPRYKIKSTRIVNNNILQLALEPRHNRDRINFVAGQYASIRFRIKGRPSPMRSFSIVSSPNSINELRFAIRIEGDFTNTLASLSVGSSILVRGPFGNFVIDEHYDKNIIMLAGGIGITPFMSMLKESAELHRPNRLTLLYSNQSQDNIPFKDELVELERINPNFKSAFFVSKGSVDKLSSYRTMRGRIDEDFLVKLTRSQFNRFTFFICGPHSFILGMKSILKNNGVEFDRIVTEEFAPQKQLSSAILPKDKATRLTYALSGTLLVVGVIFIMGIDLVRAVPKIELADNLRANSSQSQVTTSVQPSPTTTTTPAALVTQSAAPPATNPAPTAVSPTPVATSTPTTTPVVTTPVTTVTAAPTPAPTPQPTYTAPVTRVS